MKPDLNQTLEQLEKETWKNPGYDSYLATTIYSLRKKPLKDFSINDLRIVIGQNMGLDHLIPIAIEKLRKNLLAEGDFYPGDLLNNVLEVDESYWKKNKKQWQAIIELVESKRFVFESASQHRKLKRSFERFQQINDE